MYVFFTIQSLRFVFDAAVKNDQCNVMKYKTKIFQ